MPKTPRQYRTWIEIDAAALRHNLAALRSFLAPQVKMMAVVKSNAYGHGLLEVARTLSESDSDIWYGAASRTVSEGLWYGVDSLEEALLLRKEGFGHPILILGYTLRDALPEVVHAGARQVVYNHTTAAVLAEAAEKQRKQALVHLKIETGTARQGIHLEQIPEFIDHIRKEHPHVTLDGVYTHFADIEDNPVHEEPYWRAQLARFHDALARFSQHGFSNLTRHTAASAAAILYPETHFDMVRFGIALYGLWPSKTVSELALRRGSRLRQGFGGQAGQESTLQLKPVLSWKTRIAQIKKIPAGHPIGYGLTERVTRDTKLAILPVGYWDGYDRGLSRIGEVLIGGKRAKILGRVCMNMIMADATDIPEASVEDEAVLIGAQGNEEVTAEELAEKLGTINYEIVTRINPLIPRIVTE